MSIVGNKNNGIMIQGQNNKTVVSNNHLIAFNAQSGIKVEKEAFPTISNNKIYKNYKEGVLVVENSSAVVEKNQITHNIECNVAIGGKLSHHSAVIDNVLSDSAGTGIYIVKSGRIKIIRNDISNNQDGVVSSGSCPEIQRNNIFQNKNNGIICESKSYPNLT